MTENLNQTAKQIANEIIALSITLDYKVEKWSDQANRPDDLKTTECVGFINKETAADGMNIVVDLQAKANDDKATLRTWAIHSQPDNNNIERFNNIQLEFAVDYNQARSFTNKGSEITRDDLRTVINLPDTRLTRVVVSNQSGMDKESGHSLGERYELKDGEEGDLDKINTALHTTMSTLKEFAGNER